MRAASRGVGASGAGLVLVVVLVFLAGRSLVPGYSQPSSIRAMAVLAAFLGIAAIGQVLVVLNGHIDLSVPALIGAGNVIAARLAGDGVNPVVIVLVVLATGFAIGLVSGVVIARWNVPSLVVTLAVASVVGGGVLVWTKAQLLGEAPSWLPGFTSSAASTGPLPVPPVVVLWIGLVLVGAYLLRATPAGRKLYLAGVNPRAARLMLVGDRTVTAVVFALSGMFAALTGMLLTGFTGGGLYTVGEAYLFSSIAAVVVGGNSLLGGRGGIVRAALGAIALTELTTLLVGFSLDSSAQQAVLGALIVVVVVTYGREQALRDQI
ncbi:hypothetical protein BJF90_13460 [Pseudonocardia sp. CNS-004]|nr:hypothetical protein BJF90_13460 [Pseudonocardia sp. CNS-004]